MHKYKIYFFDEAHKLTGAGQNALLKVLEEPPKHTILILGTTDESGLIPTIQSRVIAYRLNEIETSVIEKYLIKVSELFSFDIPFDIIKFCATNARGSMRDGLRDLEKVSQLDDVTLDKVKATLGYIGEGQIIALVELMIKEDIGGTITYIHYLNEQAFKMDNIAQGLIYWAQAVLHTKSGLQTLYSNKETIKAHSEQVSYPWIKNFYKSILDWYLDRDRVTRVKIEGFCLDVLSFEESKSIALNPIKQDLLVNPISKSVENSLEEIFGKKEEVKKQKPRGRKSQLKGLK